MSSRDPHNWMWAEACEFIERAERLHRQFFQLSALSAPRPSWQPPIDIYETTEALWLMVALPGVPADHLDIRIEGTAIIITGTRPLPELPHDTVVHRLEIPHGRFERRIELSADRFQLEKHELANGCLTIGLRKLI